METLKKVISFVTISDVFKPIIIIFIFGICPSSGSSMFFFQTTILGFSPEFIGELQLVFAMGNIAGIWIYNKWFRNYTFKKIFTVTQLIGTAVGLAQIIVIKRWNLMFGISDKAVCITINVLLCIIG